MSTTDTHRPPAPAEAGPKRLGVFERYLTVWVGLGMVTGAKLTPSVPLRKGAERKNVLPSASNRLLVRFQG